MELRMVSWGGGSMKSNSSRLSMLRLLSSSTTLQRLVLWISGMLFSKRSSLKMCAEQRRQQWPGPVLPALPDLWLALACEMGVICRASIPMRGLYTFSLQKPVSITYFTPSKVREVSAILVATMHFRNSELSKIFACSSERSCEQMGRISSLGAFSRVSSFYWMSLQVHSMSYCPVMKMRMSPGGCWRWIATAFFTAASTQSFTAAFQKYFCTGKILPGISKMGAFPKKAENFSAFMVAEVMMILISLLFWATFLRMPKSTSVFKLLSWASSMMMALYISSSSSFKLSLSKTPSVMYFMMVWLEVQSSKRMEYPTILPNSIPIYSETLFATETAATLLGCVQPIMPYLPQPSSNKYWVICVVFPLPVSPTMMTTLFYLTIFLIQSRTSNTGNIYLCCFSVLFLEKSVAATLLPLSRSENLAPSLQSTSPSAFSFMLASSLSVSFFYSSFLNLSFSASSFCFTLCLSVLSRYSLTTVEPFLARMAISASGSLTTCI